MKTSLLQLTTRRQARRGSALLIVLAVLVLLTTLAVGLLLRAGNEQGSAAGLRALGNTSALTDRVVNLVQAQINEATTLDATSAWASQPGAIRVFNNSGNLEKVYRLYSSGAVNPNVTDGLLLANDVPPDNWNASPAMWVDLNSPAHTREADGTTTLQFPILDPRDPTAPGTINAPSVIAPTKLKGFHLGRIPGYTTGANGTSGATDVPGATAEQPVPMPVQWLYILQDGKMVVPGSGTGGDIAVVPGATTNNPIVGRVAYWTDDECAKVNINTAAGNARGDGTYASWDTPHFGSYQDTMIFAKSQPLSKEYQRYPGHPATTNFYDILVGLGFNPGAYPSAVGTSSAFFTLLPYYNDDFGSKQGTQYTVASSQGAVGSNSPTAKSHRLYTSLSELFYDRNRTVNSATVNRNTLETGKFFLTTTSRAPEVTLFGTPRISMWPVDAQIMTAGTKTRVTAYDQVIAFCSSVGRSSGTTKYPYFFQKQNSTSPTADWTNIQRNRELYEYMFNLTRMNIPGFGGSFSSKYTFNGEWEQILTEIFDYIRCVNLRDMNFTTASNQFAPGSGGWGTGQVVPIQIERGAVSTQGLGRYFTLSEIGFLVVCTADGNGPAPTANNSAYDWRSVSNLATPQPLRNASGQQVGEDGAIGGNFPANPTLTDGALSSGQKRFQAMLLLEPHNPMMGSAALAPAFKVQVRGLNNVRFSGTSGGTANPFTADDVLVSNNGRMDGSYNLGGAAGGIRWMTGYTSGSPITNSRVSGWGAPAPSNPRLVYPFVSVPFTLNADTTGSTMSVSGTFVVEIYMPNPVSNLMASGPRTITPASDLLIQTFTITLPATNVPVPDLLQDGLSLPSSAPTKANDWWGIANRIAWVNSAAGDGTNVSRGAMIRTDGTTTGYTTADWRLPTSIKAVGLRDSAAAQNYKSDTVFTIIPFQNDTRLTAAKKSLGTAPVGAATQADLVPHEFYGTRKLAHSFTHWLANAGNRIPGYSAGRLARGVTNIAAHFLPKVPTNLPIAISEQGDWDSGWPTCADGAFANKADEGNINGTGATITTDWGTPYWGSLETQSTLGKYHSPNRIVPSAVMLGSLPTGVKENVAWRTLCFRPQINRPLDPVSGPKDYLLLDLFHMPIVDPYAISEPLSTAGKINMNYAIVPFSYITRSTGVRAVLSSEMVARVPAARGNNYKSYSTAVTTGNAPARLPINLSEVNGALRQFQERFSSGDIFRSPAEICSIYLPPDASNFGGSLYAWASDTEADAAWYNSTGDFALLGDNVRERPYAGIYPRLTTKSNTFKVYYTVQALKNPRTPGGDPTRWDETKGVVEGEFRGSTTLERFIDPENPNIRDYATDASLYTPGNANAKTLDAFYQWRIISNNAFPQ
ncbi:hypothetical protein DB346_09095 [Verrucomicrobia bacterium LW23]|nr:hypothetical protein DB346_09095 [Verrucomicrobia bacterium LW23]